MSQWGRRARFRRGDTIVDVVPHVTAPDFWAPVTTHGIVEELTVTDIVGDHALADVMLRDLRERFVGRAYGVFLDEVDAPVPLP